MLEALIELGKIRMDSMDLIDTKLESIRLLDKNNKPNYIIKINFDTINKKIEVISNEEVSDSTAKEYLWIGRDGGPNSRQWNVTFSSAAYLITEVLNQIYLKDISEELNVKIKEILKDFFYEIDTSDEKYKYFLKMDKYLDYEEDIWGKLNNGKIKKAQKDLIKDFESLISKKTGISKKNIGLFTLMIDGKPIAKLKDFREFLINYYTETENKKSKNICSYCLSSEGVDSKNPNKNLKYFGNNLYSFASEYKKKNYISKNFALCKKCMDNLNSGENFAYENLRTRTGKYIDTLIIPHFFETKNLEFNKLNRISEVLLETYNNSKNIEAIDEFKSKIERLTQSDIYYLINFIFIEIGQNGIKIKKIIEDVNPDIFSKIADADMDSKKIVDKYYRYKTDYKFGGLDAVYFTLPLLIGSSDITNYRLMLDIYSSILNLKKLNYKTLIKKWTDIYSIIYYENSSYNISPKTNKILSLENKIVDLIYILEFYKNLGILDIKEGGLNMEIDLSEKMVEFINEMKFDDEKTAMFLMGYLVGEIGRKQNKLNESGDGSYKPILNKINFNGIDMRRITRLSTDLFEKMRQLKIASYNENTYHQMMKLINKNKENWSLDKNENLFYLMTGYGFKNYKNKNKDEEENSNE